MKRWSYELEKKDYGVDTVTFCVYTRSNGRNEHTPLFKIDQNGFNNIDGHVQSCFNAIDLDKKNYLKIIGVDIL